MNYTNLDIILKLKPIHYIFNDREVFVFFWINGEISKDITYSLINYKDYPPDYLSIVLIVIPIFLQVEPVDIDLLERPDEFVWVWTI